VSQKETRGSSELILDLLKTEEKIAERRFRSEAGNSLLRKKKEGKAKREKKWRERRRLTSKKKRKRFPFKKGKHSVERKPCEGRQAVSRVQPRERSARVLQKKEPGIGHPRASTTKGMLLYLGPASPAEKEVPGRSGTRSPEKGREKLEKKHFGGDDWKRGVRQRRKFLSAPREGFPRGDQKRQKKKKSRRKGDSPRPGYCALGVPRRGGERSQSEGG